MAKVIFLIDGFNLYHSVSDAEEDSDKTTKWLNIKSLCVNHYLPMFGQSLNIRLELGEIFYYSAIPSHRRKETQEKHGLYMDVLRDSGITVNLARFQPKDIECRRCNKEFKAYMEKETDVAIASKLLEIGYKKSSEVVVM